MDLSISGLASGFDWKSLVAQLIQVERAPEDQLRNEQSTLQQRNNAFGSIKTQLGVVQNRLADLKDPALFNSRVTSVGDSDLASASASTAAAAGSYAFSIIQLATRASQQGTANIGAPLSATNDVSGLVLANAGFASSVTAGTFTVNGQQVTIATTDTLKGVFDKISAATGGVVTGSYDAASDKIALTGSSMIVLGSTTDTSNFLQLAKLYNTGTTSVTSASALGGARLTAALSASNLQTALSDGGSGAGAFKINGVSIQFNASSDSLANILQRINDSAAGVTASYDATNDQFVLRNKGTGDLGFSLQDVTGNFLAATGLSGGSLQRGKNLRYTVDGGTELVSSSNIITEASSGIAGLTVTALAEGDTQISVASDTAKIKQAITGFIDEYNKAQSYIDSQTASSTDSHGVVTAGLLAGDGDASGIASKLRSLAYSAVTGGAGVLTQLAALGIDTNGQDNSLKLSDSAKLDSALANNLSGVRDLFTNATDGVAVRLNTYVDNTIGDSGSLTTHQSNLTKESGNIDTQIADMERLVLAHQQQLTDSFVAMEAAQAQINQQLQYLTQTFK